MIWNPDGSTAELSGNGTRIAARWLARRDGLDRVRISVGPVTSSATMRDGKQVETEMGKVEVGETEPLHVDGRQYEMVPVAVGNPHAVIRHAPDHDEFLRLGPAVENHERFPQRTNVQFAASRRPARHDRGASGSEVRGDPVLRHERRCGGERGRPPRLVREPRDGPSPGGDLLVEVDADFNARLTGPAEEICTVELSEEFEL